ncbi:hypothetical protein [Streptomyces sp. NPDC059479]|uniref:hypothetical protein n=1 Tax=Streptomyces sp. NPDC059479 TaxID=3346848 RepID=UPI0036831170
MPHPSDAQLPGWQAFMDESESHRRADPHTYILAAALIEPNAVDHIREETAALRIPGQRKLHWRDESAKRQATIAQAIARLDALHLIVVRNGSAGESSERRRRKCLERMACELSHRGVTRITAESREAKQNERDMKVFDVLRSSQTISSNLRLFHEPGPAEPVLWIADAVAGAYVAARTGTPAHFAELGHLVDLVEISASG